MCCFSKQLELNNKLAEKVEYAPILSLVVSQENFPNFLENDHFEDILKIIISQF